MTKSDIAVKNRENGMNCAQAVACAFCKEAGVSEKEAFCATEGFGSGMGCGKATCGALTGAVYVVSHMKSCGTPETPTSKKDTYSVTGKLTEDFEKHCGTLVCREIKSGESVSCPDCVRLASELLEQAINKIV